MWFFYMYVASTKQSYFWFLELAPGISHNMCGVRVWCACVVCVCGVRVWCACVQLHDIQLL